MKVKTWQILIFNSLLFILNGTAYYWQVELATFSRESMIFSYVFNVMITFVFTNLILLLNHKIDQYLGFVFLGQLTIKILLYLLLDKFYVSERFELAWQVFFVPYLLCLTLEVSVILILLKYKDKNQKFSSKKT